ncbi:putative quinol monooxygenase [Candidatus Nitrotoga arctica]|uniref:Antibiotic biosynthesis monooxygenase n=1 Tax=Candidatus Nitrotoga arctica TaxID=453162 RepID=A0ABN8ALV9_9PROT|nr:putative quinol monooxygenase [Candidatus Nitrotoga arctica]CAG9933823.1 Antibiotic biosynthesis monooxygenase [Candidatus Nitrotoga arctica]
MSGEVVRVIARITAQLDKVEELKSVLLGLVEPTRLEKGCVSYQLVQDKTDLAEFVFIEEWSSDSAIDVHMTSSHVQDAFLKAQSLLVKAPDIRKYGVLR